MWNLSVPDWQDRIRAGRSLVPELPLFQDEARFATAFFDAMRLPDVPGTPLMRDAAGHWFRDIVAALFGSRDPETNTRHIREVFCMVPKGSSKTTYGAAVMVTALLMNQRPRAEYLLVGPTQAVADLAYSQAAGIIQIDKALAKRFHIRDHRHQIVDRLTNATLSVKTFDVNVLTGPRPVGVLVDELHVLGRNPHAIKVLRQIRGGLEKATEGFLIMITTQSDQPPAGVFESELRMARAIRDGRFQGRMLPVIYEFPDDIARDPARWQNPANWPMVMPNLGRSIHLDSLIRDWEAERAKGPAAMQVWASQHLNIEIGLGLKTDRWRGADHWPKRAEPGLTLDELLGRSEVVTVGIDGGGQDDMLGLAIVGRERVTRRWLHWGRAWIHPDAMEQRRGETSTWQGFIDDGDLEVVDDLTDAYAELAGIVARTRDLGLLDRVGLDPAGVGLIIDALADAGIAGDDRLAAVRQGWTLNNAIKTAEVKLANGTLLHCGQRLMAYAVGNAKVEPKGNAVTITKQLSGAAKIDPLMALFNAVDLMGRNPEVRGSIWDRADLWNTEAAA